MVKKECWYKIVFDRNKKGFGPKNFLDQKQFGTKKILDQKKFDEKNVGKKYYSLEKYLFKSKQSKFGQNHLVKKNVSPEKIFGQIKL